MRRLFMLLAFFAVGTMAANAQDHPKVEIYGTYSILVADIDFLNNETLQGWGAGVQGNFNKWFGLVAEFGGNFGDSEVAVTGGVLRAHTSTIPFLFGPRVSYRTKHVTAFGHALFGGAKNRISDAGSTGSAVITTQSNIEFAMAFGGGIDINLGKSVALRAIQFDYVPIHSDLGLNGGDSQYFRNLRYQVGVVFKF